MHNGTEDYFKIEEDYKGRKFVRIYQEMDSGIVRDFFLSLQDIKQIMKELSRDGKTN
jgi:hypothetical protein